MIPGNTMPAHNGVLQFSRNPIQQGDDAFGVFGIGADNTVSPGHFLVHISQVIGALQRLQENIFRFRNLFRQIEACIKGAGIPADEPANLIGFN